MAIVRCPRGHFYDNEKYEDCPMCSNTAGPRWEMDSEKTVSLEFTEGPEERTIRLTSGEGGQPPVYGEWDSEKTVSLNGMGARELLTGWLVCTKGAARGQDYRLYPGFNRIGRNLSSDICLQDAEVSRENHCSIVYDGKSGKFYLAPGKGALTYVDGSVAEGAVEITEGTEICLGKTTLELVTFCKGDHVWEKL